MLRQTIRRRLLAATLLAALGRSLAACGGEVGYELCQTGTEGCPCSPEATCEAGLSCQGGVCALAPGRPDASGPDAVLIDTSQPVDVVEPDASRPDASGGETVLGCGAEPVADLCPCRENADCASGYCLPSSEGGKRCTSTCEQTCPEGYACLFVTLPGADPTFLCVEPWLNLCRPCLDDLECQRDAVGASGARCVRYGDAEGSFCGAACAEDADCPEAYACRDVEATGSGSLVRQCVLADATASCPCSGRSIEGSAFTSCRVDRCDGARVCEETGLTACTDPDGAVCQPSVEVSVAFDGQGGLVVGPAAAIVYLGEPYGALPDATREGYDHEGWRASPGGEVVTAETRVTTREAHTLFAAWAARSFVVSFDGAGGSPCEGRTVTFGAPYGAEGPLCTPTRAGHVFGGWHLGAGGAGERVSDDTVVATAGNHVLTARWTPALVTVTFDSEGGSPCDSLTVSFGAPYGAGAPLCVPTRPGFVFGGWHEGDNGTGAVITAGSVVTNASQHTLHARWTPATYLVTFDPDGGLAPTPPSRAVAFGGVYGPLAVTSRVGHAFGGWWTEAGGAGAEVTPATVVTSTADHTLFARWTGNRYTLRFDSRGGTPCDDQAVTFGDAYGAALTACVPDRTGHTFEGWRADPDGEGDRVDETTRVATPSNHTLYAAWTANRYSVVLSSEGGSACDAIMVTFRQPYGPLCTPERTGWTFMGWFEGRGGTGRQVTATSLVNEAGHQTLFAHWSLNSYTVTFDSQGGVSCAARSVPFGQTYGVGGPLCAPSRPGHVFGGWRTGPGGTGTPVAATTPMLVARDHTLYARWEAARLTVAFDNLGGAGCATLVVGHGETYGAGGPLCEPSRVGYVFGGWYAGAGATGSEVTATTLVTAVSDHTLWARWTPIPVTVTLVGHGGAGCPASLTVTFGEVYGTLCRPSRQGYTFAGWWTTEVGGGAEVGPSTVVTTTTSHALHARWTGVPVTVTYDNAGGAGCSSLAAVFGETYGVAAGGLLCVPTRAGYTFGGWTLGGSPITAASTVALASEHTLSARWSANGYAVRFDSEGGSACEAVSVTFGAPYGQLCASERTGYTFTGWWAGDNGSGASVTASTPVSTARDHTLYAGWAPQAFLVSFDPRGGSAAAPQSVTATFGASYGGLPMTSRPGFAFSGWWTTPEGAGELVTASTPVTRAEPHTLHARWTAENFTVTHDSAGGTPCVDLRVTFGQPYGASVGGLLCAPTRLGWTFAGWQQADGGVVTVTAATPVTTPGDHALRARWTANRYAAAFDSEGGTPCEALEVTFGQPYGPLCATTRTGYTFGGWFDGDDGQGAPIAATTPVSTASSHTLHARWTANTYLVSFDAQGGSPATPLTVSATFGASYGALPTTTRAGYAFGGWWTGAAGTGSPVSPGTLVTRAEPHTLFANWVADGFIVTYDNAGGAGCSAHAVTFGERYDRSGPLCTPTRAGHTFKGWQLSGNLVTGATAVTVPTTHALVAQWGANTYTVRFDSEGGSACPEVSVTFGAAYGALPCTPARNGFTFTGWFDGDGGTGAAVTETRTVSTASEHTLFAGWSPVAVAVTFDAGEGTAASPPGRTVTFGGLYGVLSASSRVGYALAGWRTAPAGGGDVVTPQTEVTRASGHTLFAHWVANAYVVRLDSGAGSACADLPVTYGEPYGALCGPTRPGYSFAGWWTGPGGAGVSVNAVTPVTTAADHTLYARWTPVVSTVSFDTWGGTPSTLAPQSATFDATYGTLPATTRTGYAFAGWWTAPGSGGEEVTPATRVATPSNHTLFARWTALSFTVRHDSTGGVACVERTVTFGAAYGATTGGALCQPSRAGYGFAGWWTSLAADGVEVTGSTPVAIAADHTLFARWTASSYTVTFDAQGGTTPSPDSRSVVFGSAYGALPETTRAGFAFLGWWTAPTGGLEVTASTRVDTAGAHALYARWTANTWTVTFDARGGASPVPASLSATFGRPYGDLAETSRSGYTFAGWWTAVTGGERVLATTPVATSGPHTLFARWTANAVLVRFDSQSGDACPEVTVTFGLPYGTLCTPTRAGFNFAGWWTATTGGNEVTASTEVSTPSTHTLFARWTARSFQVTLDAQGGSACPPVTVTFGQPYGPLCTPTLAGFTMTGWWTTPASGGTEIQAETVVATPSAHTLYARWTPRAFTDTEFIVWPLTGNVRNDTQVRFEVTALGGLPENSTTRYCFEHVSGPGTFAFATNIATYTPPGTSATNGQQAVLNAWPNDADADCADPEVQKTTVSLTLTAGFIPVDADALTPNAQLTWTMAVGGTLNLSVVAPSGVWNTSVEAGYPRVEVDGDESGTVTGTTTAVYRAPETIAGDVAYDVIRWKSPANQPAGASNGTTTSVYVRIVKVRSAEVGALHACAINSIGQLKCWGSNASKQLGLEDTSITSLTSPSQRPWVSWRGRRAKLVTAGGDHTCATFSDGAATCWGDDTSGELGNGSAVSVSALSSATPLNLCGMYVTSASCVAELGCGWLEGSCQTVSYTLSSIVAGSDTTCAIRTDGEALCWGHNLRGTVGNETNVNQVSPQAVIFRAGGLSTGAPLSSPVATISLGEANYLQYGRTACATLADGSGWCWGSDGNASSYETLGGHGTDANVPKPVTSKPSGRTFKRIVVGYAHACGLLDNDSVSCWSEIYASNLQSTTTQMFAGVTELAVGAYTTAVVTGGVLRTWGQGNSYSLGDGSETNRAWTSAATPSLNLAGASIVSVSMSSVGTGSYSDGSTTLVVRSDGRLSCFGTNNAGQCAQPGSILPVQTPALVAP